MKVLFRILVIGGIGLSRRREQVKNEKAWCVEVMVTSYACLQFRVAACGPVVWDTRLEKQAELNSLATSLTLAVLVIQSFSHFYIFALDT